MRTIRFSLLLILISGLLSLNSCVTVSTCAKDTPDKKLMGGKKLKNLVSERDMLCSKLAGKEEENTKLLSDLNGLQNEHSVLNDKYRNLVNENVSQADRFNKSLAEKSEELKNKEKLLSEREKALFEMKQIIARQDSITRRLNDILRNALLGFNSDELSVEIKNGKVYVSMSDKLLFKSGSAAVENKGKEALSLLAEVLNKNQDIDILVEGHTDNVPIKTAIYKDNWDLSVIRATSILRILTEDHKVAATRVTASGKGEFFPRDDNATPEGRARNRRTEIILSPKLDEIMQLLNNRQ